MQQHQSSTCSHHGACNVVNSHLESNTGSVYIGGEHSNSSAGVLGGTGSPTFLPGRGTPSVETDGYFSLFMALLNYAISSSQSG